MPLPPCSLVVTNTAHNATLRWELMYSKQQQTGLELYIYPGNFLFFLDANETLFTVDGLTSTTTYTAHVRGVKGFFKGDHIESIFRTDPNPPTNAEIVEVSETSMVITSSPPEDSTVTSYIVMYKERLQNLTGTCKVTELQTVCRGLTPGRVYEISMQTVDDSWTERRVSSPVLFTFSTRPLTPTEVQVVTVESTSVTLDVTINDVLVTALHVTSIEHGGIQPESADTADCYADSRHFNRDIFTVTCPAGCSAFGKSIWGTGVYTDDSGICRAAIHDGRLTDAGGQVTVYRYPGQDSYLASQMNGVQSDYWGSWGKAFSFNQVLQSWIAVNESMLLFASGASMEAADNALDNDDATYWSPENLQEEVAFIIIDLQRLWSVSQVMVHSVGNGINDVITVTVQASDIGHPFHWTDMLESNKGELYNSGPQIFGGFTGVGRYWKIGLQTLLGFPPHLTELGFYGNEAPGGTCQGSGNCVVFPVTNIMTQVTLTGYKPATEYVVGVVAATDQAHSLPMFVTFMTAPEPVTNVNSSSDGLLSSVAWDPPSNNLVSYYKLTYGLSASYLWEQHVLITPIRYVTFPDFLQGKMYFVDIFTMYNGQESAPKRAVFSVVLGAPSVPVVTSVAATTMDVMWHYQGDAEAFRLYLAPAPEGFTLTTNASEPTWTSVRQTTSMVGRFDGLHPGLLYVIGVRAITDEDESEMSMEVHAAAPHPPENVTAVVGDGTIALTWAPPIDSVFSNYLITYTPMALRVGIRARSEILLESWETEQVVGGLKSDVDYLVDLTTVSYGVNSEPVGLNITTTYTLKPPANVAVVTTTTDSITVSWAEAYSSIAILNYEILYTTMSDANTTWSSFADWDIVTVLYMENEVKLTGLTPGFPYLVAVRVVAMGSTVERRSDEAIVVGYTEPAAPANLHVDNAANDTLILTWQPHFSGLVDFYDVIIRQPITGQEEALLKRTEEQWVDVHGLRYDTTYEVLLSAVANGARSKETIWTIRTGAPATWTDWRAIAPCSTTCGVGTQVFSRECRSLNGSMSPFCAPDQPSVTQTMLKACDELQACPVHGFWSAWGNFAPCSVSCDGGVTSRVRICNPPQLGGSWCPGNKNGPQTEVQNKNCSVLPCPTPVTTTWSDWSPCSVTCGGGIQSRSLLCDGAICPEETNATRNCSTELCEGTWASWSEYSACSETCGEGIRVRSRNCTIPEFGGTHCPGNHSDEGRQFEETTCNLSFCPNPNGTWVKWISECSVTCGNGTRTVRHRCAKINPENPFEGDLFCPGEKPDEEMTCQTHPCSINGNWGSWMNFTECSAKCGDGLRTRMRFCDNPAPQYSGLPCEGDVDKTDLQTEVERCRIRNCRQGCRRSRGSHGVEWPETDRGKTATVACPTRLTNGSATRHCDRRGRWEEQGFSDCVSDEVVNLQRKINDVNTMQAATDFVEELEVVSASIRFQKDILFIMNMVNDITDDSPLGEDDGTIRAKDSFIQALVRIIDNVYDNDYYSLWEGIIEHSGMMHATRVLTLMEKLTEAVMNYVSYQDINAINLRRNNIGMNVLLAPTSDMIGRNLSSAVGRRRAGRANLTLSGSVLTDKNNTFALPEKFAISFLNFDSLHALLTASGYLAERRQIINSRIVGVSTDTFPMEPLSVPLAIRFEHFRAGKNPKCVFLDMVNEHGLYNPSGCQVFEHTEDYTVCHCSHLQMAFALLMEIQEEVQAEPVWVSPLTGNIVALTLVTGTLGAYLVLRRYMSSHGHVVKNILLCLVVTEVTSLVNVIDAASIKAFLGDIKEVCLGLTVVSHLSVLCTFYWLVPLCLQHYLDVLSPRAESPWWKYRVLGWGLPVSAAAVTAGIKYQTYLDLNGKCVLPVEDYLIHAMTAPAGFAVLVAATVIILTVRTDHMISKNMKGAAFKKPRMEKIGGEIWRSSVLTLFLCITWPTGYVAMATRDTAFENAFGISNTILGIYTALFLGLWSQEVRIAYGRKYKKIDYLVEATPRPIPKYIP
ncbi:HMCN1 [Branchiostoma lanceolatum]|uniref:HMCN1 protein n=1 Tax=Branchiostoma lanceolatum TaxID=7740 RepID=A0A8J9YPS4_BRALA|nr:HMCN1 [Branchiostoma lanceolatum]